MSCGGSPRDSTVADVYRIERAKGLYRKRASDAPEHVVGDRRHVFRSSWQRAKRKSSTAGTARPSKALSYVVNGLKESRRETEAMAYDPPCHSGLVS
jgi:hypothetical protein